MNFNIIWEFLERNRAGKVILLSTITILFMLLCWVSGRHIYKDLKGQHSNLLGGVHEVNAQKVIIEYKRDTIIVTNAIVKQDTIVKYLTAKKQIESSQPVKNEQKIESSGSGLQNNAPNYGIQAGGNVNVSNDPILNNEELDHLMFLVEKAKNEKGVKKKIVALHSTPQSNAPKVFAQIEQHLRQNGYQVNIGQAFTASTFYGIEVSPGFGEDEEIQVLIGIM